MIYADRSGSLKLPPLGNVGLPMAGMRVFLRTLSTTLPKRVRR